MSLLQLLIAVLVIVAVILAGYDAVINKTVTILTTGAVLALALAAFLGLGFITF